MSVVVAVVAWLTQTRNADSINYPPPDLSHCQLALVWCCSSSLLFVNVVFVIVYCVWEGLASLLQKSFFLFFFFPSLVVISVSCGVIFMPPLPVHPKGQLREVPLSLPLPPPPSLYFSTPQCDEANGSRWRSKISNVQAVSDGVSSLWS